MAFNPELGSTSPAVLLDNAERLDKLVNGSALTEPDRAGVELDTWRGMMAKNDQVTEDARKSITALGLPYSTLSEAQAAVNNGQIPVDSVCYVRSTDDAVAIEYLNEAGTLVPTGNVLPSEETIDKKLNQRLVPGQYLSTWFPVFFDRNRNVYVWFDGGRWDVADFGANARTIIESVPNAWAQKFLPQGDYSPNYFPFVHDRNGNVYAWFHNGMYDGYGFGPNIEKYILNLVGGASAQSDSSFIEGDQYKFNFKKGRVFSGQAASVNTAFFGDSWNEKNTIPQSLINVLGGIYKDPAWIS
ncbi:TPA: GDSL family lipase, partial [Klebsiella pneumoniae]|nr:GDSL family lipase [Klebsiella pneumoniae]